MRRLQALEDNIGNAEVNLSPLIDVVFLLLIFFMVTTVFVEDSGIEIQQPTAATATTVSKRSIQLGVTAEGLIYFDQKTIDVNNLQGLIARLRAAEDRPVLIKADRACSSGVLIDILDECRQAAGAENVQVATQRESK